MNGQASAYSPISVVAAPPTAHKPTTITGGVLQMVRSTKPISATAKSKGAFTELVHTGL